VTALTVEKGTCIDGWLIVGVKVQNFLFDTMTPITFPPVVLILKALLDKDAVFEDLEVEEIPEAA
jgi:hypothetical protein